MVGVRSVAYLCLAAAIGYVVLMGVWIVLDQPATELRDHETWRNDTRYPNTSADEHAAAGQRMVGQVWDWAPAISLFAIGVSLLIGARDRGGP